MTIFICGIEAVRQFQGKVTHLLSVVDPEDAPYIPHLRLPSRNRLMLFCHDVNSVNEAAQREAEWPGSRCLPPTECLVKRALRFGRNLPPDARLLVHCGFGISRSPALAFALLCQAKPAVAEDEILKDLVRMHPAAAPNSLIVRLADDILKRDGEMIGAVARGRRKIWR